MGVVKNISSCRTSLRALEVFIHSELRKETECFIFISTDWQVDNEEKETERQGRRKKMETERFVMNINIH